MEEKLLITPLYDSHVALGAKMSPFAGFMMPIQYTNITDEHNAVRHHVGMFDVSHMGEVFITGPDAEKFVNHIFTNDIRGMKDGQVLYGMMLYPDGGTVDDLLVYKEFVPDCYLLVINAANIAKDYAWMQEQAKGYAVTVDNQSDNWGQIALQGPDAEKTELVTPILRYEDIETLQELCRRLRKAGAKSDATRGCGVHIHIGANGHTPQTLRNLANIMASHEDLLADALRLDRRRMNRYCRTVDPDFLRLLNQRKPKTMAALADVWYRGNGADYGRSQHYNDSRYHMLNLHATFTKGTIEFRLFQFDAPANGKQNGIHAGQLKSYIQLCLALSQLAKDVRTASPKPQQNENPKYAMRTWLLRLGFIGEEFATARDFLTRNLDGDAAFRNGRAA